MSQPFVPCQEEGIDERCSLLDVVVVVVCVWARARVRARVCVAKTKVSRHVPFIYIYTYNTLSLYFIFSRYTSFNFFAAQKYTVESPLKATYVSTAYCSFWFFFR